jgi:hypothetical protein
MATSSTLFPLIRLGDTILGVAEPVRIEEIIEAIRAKQVRVTDHADDEASEDDLRYEEIYSSVLQGEIIENYPDDKPYPSCLIFGMNFQEEPVHSVWAYNGETHWAVLITVYRPDPLRWINWRERREEHDSF